MYDTYKIYTIHTKDKTNKLMAVLWTRDDTFPIIYKDYNLTVLAEFRDKNAAKAYRNEYVKMLAVKPRFNRTRYLF